MGIFSRADSPLLKRFAANTGWLVAQNVFQYILSAVIGILAARYMGPGNYGVLGYGASLMAMFLPLCTLGIDGVQIPAMLDAPEKQGEIVGTALLLRLTSSALSILCIVALVRVLEPDNKLLLVVTALQSLQLLFQMFDAFRLWFQMELLSKYTAIGSAVGNLACSAWRIALLIRGASVEWFALTSVVQMLTNYLFVVPMFFARAKLRLSFSFAAAKALLGRGYHFILSGLTVAITNYFGRILLANQLGETALGYYNAASAIALLWIFVPQALVDSATPVLLETKKHNPDAFTPRYQAVHLAVFGIGALAAVGLAVLAPWVVTFLYSETYLPAAPLLRVLSVTGLLTSVGVSRGIWVLAEDKLKYVKYYCGIGAAASVLFNTAGIALFGMTGAAYAAVLTGLVQAFGAPLLFPGTRAFTAQYFGSFRQARRLIAELLGREKDGKS